MQEIGRRFRFETLQIGQCRTGRGLELAAAVDELAARRRREQCEEPCRSNAQLFERRLGTVPRLGYQIRVGGVDGEDDREVGGIHRTGSSAEGRLGVDRDLGIGRHRSRALTIDQEHGDHQQGRQCRSHHHDHHEVGMGSSHS